MNASGRRQRQARNNYYSHLAVRQRPNYKRRDVATAVAHEANLRRRENERSQRKGAR